MTILDESVLVTSFVHNGQLCSVSVVDGMPRGQEHGPAVMIRAEVERLRALLARRASASTPWVLSAFASGARRSAAFLEERLLGPVLSELKRGRPLVVVPSGCLHALAWAELPSCLGHSVTVAPSVRCWLRTAANAHDDPGTGTVWVAGPGLEYATREARALHRAWGGTLLVGSEANAANVLRAVDGARVVHIAAHGHFHEDQPRQSCLDMADRSLCGDDLVRLRRGPKTVVLSACEVGQSSVTSANELAGLPAAWLARGTATVIASVVPVPDQRTARVMVSLHAALQRGTAPAVALANAQAEHGESGFLCLGYGGR